MDASGAADHAASYLAVAARRAAELRSDSYKLLALAEGASVLDVGCGLGEVCADLLGFVGDSGTIVGIDLSEELVARARQQWAALPIRFEVGDGESLMFEDGSFDAVWSERVVQHLSRPGLVIAEMVRVLRPGGRALVSDPVHSATVVATEHPSVWATIRTSGQGSVRNPDAGLRLKEWMQSAGLEVELHPIARILDDWPMCRTLFGIDQGAAAAESSGAITAVQAEDFMVEQQDRYDRGVFALSVSFVRAVGTKSI